MKINKKEVKELLKNIEPNFSELIDLIIFYDSMDKDELAFEIINKMKTFNIEKKIDLLITDIVERQYKVNPSLLYNVLWYSISNSHKNSLVLIEKLTKNEHKKEIIYYLKTLNEGNGHDADINIQKIIDAVNSR
jgi:hypothetical protein